LSCVEPLLIAVGRPAPSKGYDLLFPALRAAIERVGPVNLLVVGASLRRPEHLRALRLMAGQHGVGANVTFAGWREDVDALLSASDLFVLSSRTEGFPNALVEAIAQEIPVLATRGARSGRSWKTARWGSSVRPIAIRSRSP
jgi:glycosyltransferase involved in cell wall biosynthesis